MFTRLDDGFADHPKTLWLSDAAFRLHVTAICWCNQRGTNVIHLAEVKVLIGHLEKPNPGAPETDELIKAGLWLACPEGWTLADVATGRNALLDHLAAAVEKLPGTCDEMGTRVLIDDVLTTIKDMRQ